MDRIVELLPTNLANLRIVANVDNEVWLHFKTDKGDASINLTALATKTAVHGGSMVSSKLLQWCEERLVQARQMEVTKLS